MIDAAAPPGPRPDHGATVAQALVLERAAIAQDVLHIERLWALRRQGHAVRPPSGDGRLPMLV